MIQVAVRVRPLLSDENSSSLVESHDASTLSVSGRKFKFDAVFDATSTQASIFSQSMQPLIAHVLSGSHATVFAYGATGCGKTHTMTGTLQNPGLIPRTISNLYKHLPRASQISISFLEVYNESIRDLLSEATNLAIREDDSANRVLVSGLSEHSPKSEQHFLRLITRGTENRSVGFTNANAVSSRSHSILLINITEITNKVTTLSLIDLAGSERASSTMNSGIRLTEGANINKSLLSLANCINALYTNSTTKSRKKHVPYRDSKLTRLLKYSFGPGCRVLMVANISPASLQAEETVNTLKYADRAKQINVSAPPNNSLRTRNGSLDRTEEIEALKARIQKYENALNIDGEDHSLFDLQLAQIKKETLIIGGLTQKLNDVEMRIEESSERLDLIERIVGIMTGLKGDFDVGFVESLGIQVDALHSNHSLLENSRDSFESRIGRLESRLASFGNDVGLTEIQKVRLALSVSMLKMQNVNSEILRVRKCQCASRGKSSQVLLEFLKTLGGDAVGFATFLKVLLPPLYDIEPNENDYERNDESTSWVSEVIDDGDNQSTTSIDNSSDILDTVESFNYETFEDMERKLDSTIEESGNSEEIQNVEIRFSSENNWQQENIEKNIPCEINATPKPANKYMNTVLVDNECTPKQKKNAVKSVDEVLKSTKLKSVAKKRIRQSMIPVMASKLLEETPRNRKKAWMPSTIQGRKSEFLGYETARNRLEDICATEKRARGRNAEIKIGFSMSLRSNKRRL